jgi:peptide-methionine (R)-S-oxide reductase
LIGTRLQGAERRPTFHLESDDMNMSKRTFLGSAAAVGALIGCSRGQADTAPAGTFEIERSPEEWRRLLTPAQFEVLREAGTERAGTSPLNAEKRAGTYHCAGCDLPVYRSEAKYESGTGWPSFYEPIAGAVRTRPDPGWLGPRTEVHCRRCGGHLGHVFDDGPPPTGLRYCMNGVAMTFVPNVA